MTYLDKKQQAVHPPTQYRITFPEWTFAVFRSWRDWVVKTKMDDFAAGIVWMEDDAGTVTQETVSDYNVALASAFAVVEEPDETVVDDSGNIVYHTSEKEVAELPFAVGIWAGDCAAEWLTGGLTVFRHRPKRVVAPVAGTH